MLRVTLEELREENQNVILVIKAASSLEWMKKPEKQKKKRKNYQ